MNQSLTKKIFINNKDLGFLTQEEVTVQRFEIVDGERELVWCNHAGAIEESVENEMTNPNGHDITWWDKIVVCDKCEAYRFVGDNEWRDAPEEGVSYV